MPYDRQVKIPMTAIERMGVMTDPLLEPHFSGEMLEIIGPEVGGYYDVLSGYITMPTGEPIRLVGKIVLN